MAGKRHESYLLLRGRIYYFRVMVPKRLVPIFGRTEYKKSLKTGDLKCAVRLSRTYILFVDRFFRLVEHMKPTRDDIIFLIRNHFEKCLMEVDDERWAIREDFKEGKSEEAIDELIENLRKRYARLQDEAKLSEYGPEQADIAHKLLEWQGFDLSELSDSFKELARGIMDARIEAERLLLAEFERDTEAMHIKHPLLKDARNYLKHSDFDLFLDYQYKPYHGEPKTAPLTMKEAVTRYIESQRQKGERWQKDHASYLGRLSGLLGADTPLPSLTEEKDGFRIEELVWHLPKKWNASTPLMEIVNGEHGEYETISPKTVEGYWLSFKAFAKWCAKRKLMTEDILAEVELNKPKNHDVDDRGYRSFTVEELDTIFHSPLYTGHRCENQCFWKPGDLLTRNGNYWVPLVGLFSGLREGEILYLQIRDIRCSEGVYYIDVNKMDGKSLKNKQSARRIPIHPELQKIGFLEYWEKRKGECTETDRLFDGITFPKNGKVIKNYSRNFSKFLKEIAVKESEKEAFHSFRNNYVDAMRRVKGGLNPEIMDMLDGRDTIGRLRGSRKSYGVDLEPHELSPYIEQMNFKVDLSHLYLKEQP